MWLKIMSWARKNWLWLALALVLIAVGMRWGWKLAAKLGGVIAVGGGAGLLKGRETREVRQTVEESLDRQRRRKEQAERIKEASRR